MIIPNDKEKPHFGTEVRTQNNEIRHRHTDTDTGKQTHTNRQTRGEGRGRINILTGTSNVVGKKSHLKFVSQGNTNLFIKDQFLTTTMYTMHTTFFSFWLKYAN